MTNLSIIENAKDELTAIFKDLHQHPELGFAEHRTAGIVAEKLKEYGVDEVHTGIAGTGVVGIIKSGEGSRNVGLRADMDALPINELTNLDYTSKNPGVMHACGHDGHTTMLLGAAKHLAKHVISMGKSCLYFNPLKKGWEAPAVCLQMGSLNSFPVMRSMACTIPLMESLVKSASVKVRQWRVLPFLILLFRAKGVMLRCPINRVIH